MFPPPAALSLRLLWQAGKENYSNSGNDHGIAGWETKAELFLKTKKERKMEGTQRGKKTEMGKKRNVSEVVQQDLKWFVFSWAGRVRSGCSARRGNCCLDTFFFFFIKSHDKTFSLKDTRENGWRLDANSCRDSIWAWTHDLISPCSCSDVTAGE